MSLTTNRFEFLLERLSTAALRGSLAQVCSEGIDARALPKEQMDLLEEMELVRRHLLGWKPTWLGLGVNNWRRQLEASLFRDPVLPVPEPSQYENGHDHAPPCDHYRERYFSPGTCWCLRPPAAHRSYVSRLASEFLTWHNDQIRRKQLQAQGSGRPLRHLLGLLTELEKSVLQYTSIYQSRLPKLGELAIHHACRYDFFSLKLSVDRLQALELLESSPHLATTWDGRGVCQMALELEQIHSHCVLSAEPRPGENGVDPMPEVCGKFRSLLSVPDRCWCGWQFADHNSPQLAEA